MLHLAARSYLGVPWAHQGRDPSIALDCIGLALCVARDCGMPLSAQADIADYGRNPAAGLLERRLAQHMGPSLPVSAMRAGDLVAMRFRGPVRHVGIIGDHEHGLSIIHASTSQMKVVEHRIDARWLRYIAAVHRWESAQ